MSVMVLRFLLLFYIFWLEFRFARAKRKQMTSRYCQTPAPPFNEHFAFRTGPTGMVGTSARNL